MLGFLWFLFARPDPALEPPIEAIPAPDTAPRPAVVTAPVRVIPPNVARFIAFVDSRTASGAAIDKQYAVEALRLLADALLDAAGREVSAPSGERPDPRTVDTVGAPLQPPAAPPAIIRAADILRQNADSVEVRIGDYANARRIHTALTAASGALEQIRPGAFRAPAIAADTAAMPPSGSIDPARPLSEQGDDLQRFFERAAAALRSG